MAVRSLRDRKDFQKRTTLLQTRRSKVFSLERDAASS